jgi:hypothetical protein
MVPSGQIGADADAHWGHRHSTQPGQQGEMFYGYYEQVVTMTRDEDGPAVPELVRGMTFSPAATTQAPLLTDLLARLVAGGLRPGDLLADSGYTNIDGWTLSLWAMGFRPVIDLHPNQQGRRGAFEGAFIVDDLLLSPGTPKKFQLINPPGFGASAKAWAAYDELVAQRSNYALVPFGRRDADGYQRYMCPASAGHVCCALKESSVSVELTRLTVPRPPKRPPRICAQATITVPPTIADKARQKHPWKSKAWRKSYRRRTAVERSWGYTKSKATVDLTRGNVRLMGCTKNALMHAIAWAVVNYRLLTAWAARQAASSTPSVPRSRRRRRDQTYADATRQESRPSSRAP